MQITDISHSQEIYSVSRLNREVRFLLEGSFPLLWIEGEISNFTVPNSGHWYFSLKDSEAQVRCAMFKNSNRFLPFKPKDGLQVLMKARVCLYEGRGEFQLIVEHLEEAGIGKLRQAFEALKIRLAAAGLFDSAHKKKLPKIPRCVGIITSPTGAAIRDILSVLKRRYAAVPIIIYPSLVQGDPAALSLVNALRCANQRNECDVLILARGGGSLEDLWPFNEEIVAQAIFQSQIPIISGVGHEIDFTIADFVADVRAPTPSAAAELITPDSHDLLQSLAQYQKHFLRAITLKTQQIKQQLTWSTQHLQHQHPQRKLHEQAQQLDFCEATLIRLQHQIVQNKISQLQHLKTRLISLTPYHRIQELQQRLAFQQSFLHNRITQFLHKKQDLLAQDAAKLNALSPLATLKRGFAIATTLDQQTLYSSLQVKPGDCIYVQLDRGKLFCTVKKTESADVLE